MSPRKTSKGDSLRQRAVGLLSKKPEVMSKIPPKDVKKLIHELQVHQIELEMQNEELRKAQAEIESSRSRYFDLYDFAPIGYVTLDRKGTILEANLAAANLLDVERSKLLSRPFIRFVSPESRNRFHLHLERVFSTSKREVCELELIKKSGKSYYVSLKSASSKNNEGHSIQCRSAIIDITERMRAQEELQKAHAKVLETSEVAERARKYAESIIETIREPLLVLSSDLRVISGNRSFYQIFKVTPEETLGRYIYDLGNRQWDILSLRQLLEDILPKNSKFENFEVEHDFPTIGKRSMLLNARRIYWKEEVTHMILIAFEDITERRQAEEALKKAHDEIRFFASQCLTAQETERKRVASELHDSIAASLTAMILRIDRIAEDIRRGHGSPESLQDLASMVTDTNDEVRRIMVDLRPSVLDDLGIIAAVKWFSREYQKTYAHISVENQIGISEDEVPASLKTSIFRISQEAMNNIAKHSKATHVNLSLRREDNKILLTIRDNGQGFDLETVKRGLGLSTMVERAKLSRGTCTIESIKGVGTTIRCLWPWT